MVFSGLVSGSFSRLSFSWFLCSFRPPRGALGGVIFGVFLENLGFVGKRGTLDSDRPVWRFCMILGVRASPKGVENDKNDFWKIVFFLV